MKISTLIKKLKFDRVNSNITDDLFPDSGERGKDHEIFHFNKYISSEYAIEEMNKQGYRPMTAHELLEWAKDNWNGEDWVMALGSVVAVDGLRCVACLGRLGRGRYLYLSWFGLGWYEHYRFAAVRKSENLEPKKLGAGTELETLVPSEITINGEKYKLTKIE